MSVPPPEVAALVDRFARNRDAYRNPAYNEAQTRREFIDPLFKALGWDLDNVAGLAEAYKDVIHEDAIKVGGATKAPDYCFRIGGTRKFFVEAKKPAVGLETEPEPAYQLRRYAWTSKLPLSILTDFEEFAVYDCRIRPSPTDKPSAARVFYCTCDDYAEKWDWIAGLFSKDAVLKGAFDKYAESAKRKKGTAEVDAEFLRQIEDWREMLAQNFALRNPQLSVRDLNFAVQRTIDRLVFLRMCEDRGVETYGGLQALLNGDHAYDRLGVLFRQADDRYNSGLFHFTKETGREPPDELTLSLKLDDKVLKEIIKGLYYPESPYEFSVLPPEVLGQVYEQFLGKVIRLTAGHHAKVEEKPEVRKAGGVYYTPAYIVDYIVKNTVGKLLEGKTPAEIGPDVASPPRGRRGRRATAVSAVRPLRILDPACGSGSFLLGAYQFLLNWHRDCYVAQMQGSGRPPGRPSDDCSAGSPCPASPPPSLPLYQGPGGQWLLTIQEKKRILLNHIYGVDIDPQAVETTKLSLLLKVLEGESEQTIGSTLRLFHERALPDLDKNIKCGNSLIGPDFYDGQQMTMFDEDERLRINVFDWAAEFPEVFRGPGSGSRVPGPQPRVPSPESRAPGPASGFDAVIGNPPYGALLTQAEKGYLLSHYPNQTYQLDSYQLFLEQAVAHLLKSGGYYGMIIPNPWLTNLLQTSIRRLVLNATRVVDIVHFRFPVFPKVTVDTEIVVLERSDPKNWKPRVLVVESPSALSSGTAGPGVVQLRHAQNMWQDGDGNVINIFLSPHDEALARKCRTQGTPLSVLCTINVGIKPYQVGKGKPPQTRSTVDQRPYDADRRIDRTYRAYLRGSDIQRYEIVPVEPRYMKYGPWLAEPRPAARFDAPVKLLMRQTGDSLVAAIDSQQYLCLNNMHVIVPNAAQPAPEYLLAILNSRLLNWYYHTLNPEVGEALAEVKKTNVARLPIRTPDFATSAERSRHDRLVALVQQMLDLHKELAAAKTPAAQTALQRQIDATDRQIDQLVYQLYGLTDEEIHIVEEATKL